MTAAPIYFAPDLDPSWNTNPGIIQAMRGWVPMVDGSYGVAGFAFDPFSDTGFTGSDILTAQFFRQTDDSVRFLVFRKQNIDEYANDGTIINQGTSYSSSTTDWSAAAWGDQIIACNYLDATQSSTGTTFSDLSGAPKARFVAANLDHIVLADVDDGGSNVFADMVWWSNLQDSSTWTPAIGGEAGNYRLRNTPGPITALVAFQDVFVAFKEHSMYIGRYTGSQYVFDWRPVSNSVGCFGSKAVVELDNKLYFVDATGFWCFDGQSLQNIGTPVNRTFLKEYGYLFTNLSGFPEGPPSGFTIESPASCQATADTFNKVVWFSGSYYDSSNTAQWLFLYGYNTVSQKWGRVVLQSSASNVTRGAMVRGSMADQADYFGETIPNGLLLVLNGGPRSKTQAFRMVYPSNATYFSTYTDPIEDGNTSYMTTGLMGSEEQSTPTTQVDLAIVSRTGSAQLAADSANLLAYNTQDPDETATTVAGTVNTERKFAFQFNGAGTSSKYKKFQFISQGGAGMLKAIDLRPGSSPR